MALFEAWSSERARTVARRLDGSVQTAALQDLLEATLTGRGLVAQCDK